MPFFMSWLTFYFITYLEPHNFNSLQATFIFPYPKLKNRLRIKNGSIQIRMKSNKKWSTNRVCEELKTKMLLKKINIPAFINLTSLGCFGATEVSFTDSTRSNTRTMLLSTKLDHSPNFTPTIPHFIHLISVTVIITNLLNWIQPENLKFIYFQLHVFSFTGPELIASCNRDLNWDHFI